LTFAKKHISKNTDTQDYKNTEMKALQQARTNMSWCCDAMT